MQRVAAPAAARFYYTIQRKDGYCLPGCAPGEDKLRGRLCFW